MWWCFWKSFSTNKQTPQIKSFISESDFKKLLDSIFVGELGDIRTAIELPTHDKMAKIIASSSPLKRDIIAHKLCIAFCHGSETAGILLASVLNQASSEAKLLVEELLIGKYSDIHQNKLADMHKKNTPEWTEWAYMLARIGTQKAVDEIKALKFGKDEESAQFNAYALSGNSELLKIVIDAVKESNSRIIHCNCSAIAALGKAKDTQRAAKKLIWILQHELDVQPFKRSEAEIVWRAAAESLINLVEHIPQHNAAMFDELIIGKSAAGHDGIPYLIEALPNTEINRALLLKALETQDLSNEIGYAKLKAILKKLYFCVHIAEVRLAFERIVGLERTRQDSVEDEIKQIAIDALRTE